MVILPLFCDILKKNSWLKNTFVQGFFCQKHLNMQCNYAVSIIYILQWNLSYNDCNLLPFI